MKVKKVKYGGERKKEINRARQKVTRLEQKEKSADVCYKRKFKMLS